MNKKRLFILLGMGFFLLTVIIISLTRNSTTTKTGSISPSTAIYPTSIQAPPKKINVSGIKTNDFLSYPIKTTPQGDVLFIKTSSYHIIYLKQFGEFIINISTSSAKARENAESAFLEKLGISREEACRLKVFISAPYVPNPSLSVQKKTLSFCPNS